MTTKPLNSGTDRVQYAEYWKKEQVDAVEKAKQQQHQREQDASRQDRVEQTIQRD
jgi:hypothetical protein